VNANPTPQKEPQEPLGIIACVATGFEMIARHPTLLLLPILLDLFLWLGPRLSLTPIFQDFAADIHQLAQLPEIPADMRIEYISLENRLTTLGDQLNFFSILSPLPLLGLPSLMTLKMPVEGPNGARPEWFITTLLPVPLVLMGLFLVGLGLNARYVYDIANVVIAETTSPVPGPTTPVKLWHQLINVVLLILGVLLLGFFALVCFIIMMMTINPTIANLFLTLVMAFITFQFLHLPFTLPGLVLTRRTPREAIQESFMLMRGDFLTTFSFIFTLMLISWGFNVIWLLPVPTTWATLVGIGGHAFISTALLIALFIFYLARLDFLASMGANFAPTSATVQSASGLN